MFVLCVLSFSHPNVLKKIDPRKPENAAKTDLLPCFPNGLLFSIVDNCVALL